MTRKTNRVPWPGMPAGKRPGLADPPRLSPGRYFYFLTINHQCDQVKHKQN